MNKLSYCMLGDSMAVAGIEQYTNKGVPMLSGLWQWHLAFDKHGKKGEVRLIRRKEELEDYDVVHVNMTAGNFGLPHMIRDQLGESSSTKLISNIDFEVGAWGQLTHPTMLEKVMQCADMVFHVETRGADVLTNVLDRPVPALPHPVDVDGIDRYKKTDREPYIANVYHRYYPDITIPYWVIRDLPLYSMLLGYGNGKVPSLPMYDQVFGHIPFVNMLENMSKAKFGIDLFHGYNYGRTVVEFAALAIPCVCSETIDAAHRCFPDLVVNPFDVKKAHDLFTELIDDDEKYIDVFTRAYEAAGYYSQKNCYDRMVEALEEITT